MFINQCLIKCLVIEPRWLCRRSAMFRADRAMESRSFECTTNFTAVDDHREEYAKNTPSYRYVYTGMPLDIVCKFIIYN